MSENDLPSLTRDELLASSKSSSQRLLESPFVNAAAHTLVQGPVDALSQVIDKTAGTNLLPSLRLIPEAKKTEFGSGEWFQQTVGGAVGALPYLLALHAGSKQFLSKSMLSADTRLLMNAGAKLGGEATRQVARFELSAAGLTGLSYGGLLTPVRAEESGTTSDFIAAKFRHAAVGAGTFMTMHASMIETKSLAERFKPGILQTALKSDIGAGALSGLPAGMFAAQWDSILQGKGFASAKDTSESVLGFSLIGGLMPAGQRGIKFMSERVAAPKPASETIPIESLSAKDISQMKNPMEAPSVLPIERIFSPEQLKIIREWKETQANLKETKFRETDPDFIKRLADEAYGAGAAVQGRELHILLGNCGAGKSRVTDALARELGAMTPDSDLIKPKIPGYEKGMGNQAVHEDSSAAYKMLLDRALATGDNIVWQGVGKTSQSVVELIQQAKQNGYKVSVHMIDAPPEVASLRVFNRANGPPEPGTGIRQMIPPEVPLNPKYQYIPRQNFMKMVAEAAEAFHNGQGKSIHGFKLWRSTQQLSQPLPVPRLVPPLDSTWVPPKRVDEPNIDNDMFMMKLNLQPKR